MLLLPPSGAFSAPYTSSVRKCAWEYQPCAQAHKPGHAPGLWNPVIKKCVCAPISPRSPQCVFPLCMPIAPGHTIVLMFPASWLDVSSIAACLHLSGEKGTLSSPGTRRDVWEVESGDLRLNTHFGPGTKGLLSRTCTQTLFSHFLQLGTTASLPVVRQTGRGQFDETVQEVYYNAYCSQAGGRDTQSDPDVLAGQRAAPATHHVKPS